MNLNDLNDGTPATKQWLNIVADSIKVNNVLTIPLGLAPINTSPLTLTAAQTVGALYDLVPLGVFVVNLPTATDLDTLLNISGISDLGVSFEVNFYLRGTSVSLVAGAGTLFAGGASPLLITPGLPAVPHLIRVIYRKSLSWYIYV